VVDGYIEGNNGFPLLLKKNIKSVFCGLKHTLLLASKKSLKYIQNSNRKIVTKIKENNNKNKDDLFIVGENNFGQLGNGNTDTLKKFTSLEKSKIKFLPNQNKSFFLWSPQNHLFSPKHLQLLILVTFLSLKVIQKKTNLKLPKPIILIILHLLF
jgi:hypothetical protein